MTWRQRPLRKFFNDYSVILHASFFRLGLRFSFLARRFSFFLRFEKFRVYSNETQEEGTKMRMMYKKVA
jgi:hypothetical protein